MKTSRSEALITSAFLFSAIILVLGYISFGFWTMMIFSSGFLVGFFLWLIFPSNTPYARLRLPYWLAFLFFILHRVEEKTFGFFDFLSRITGVSTPEVSSWNVIALIALSVGSWLAVPWLLKRQSEFGYYLAWTFFTAMGVTELAHWIVFPFFTENTFTYIPGMISVIPLAPIAWWAMWRLYREGRADE